MEYYKLIALHIDDFCSSIFFKDNYGLDDISELNENRQDLESKGYVCFVVKTVSNIQI